jgi:hypothetical protein
MYYTSGKHCHFGRDGLCFTGFYSQSEVVLAVFYCFTVRELGLVGVLVVS